MEKVIGVYIVTNPKGRKHSPETKAKIREAALRREARKRKE